MRLKVFHVILSILLFIPLCGLVYLQLMRGGDYFELSQKNYIRLIPQEASRGRILDRNGVVLADNIASFNVSLVPQELVDKERVFSYLSTLLKTDQAGLERTFYQNYAAPFSPVVVARKIPKDTAVRIEEERFQFPGLLVEIVPQRFYTYRDACAHALGYLGSIDRSTLTRLKDYGYKIRDIVGYSGVEEYYDRYLRGEGGGTQVAVDHRGRQKGVLGVRTPKAGKEVTITIDIRMQQAAYEALDGHVGSIVIMDPYTGEILTLVSSPSFNPNIFLSPDSSRQVRRLLNDPERALLNRALAGQYPPGSTFKIITALAGLQARRITPHTTVLCNGKMHVGNKEFGCSQTHGLQDLRDAVVHSCNIFFYQAGIKTGAALLYQYATDFGFGRITGIDMPSEARGNISNPGGRRLWGGSRWFDGDTANFSIGQGELLATPLQMVRVMAAVVNGGILVVPHILKSIGDESVRISPAAGRVSVSASNLDLLRSYLRAVVSDQAGTAHILNLEKLSVAGKTGTAQAGQGASHGWFVGFYPAKDPRVVFCIMLEHGGSSYNACLVARQLLERFITEDLLSSR